LRLPRYSGKANASEKEASLKDNCIFG